MTGPHQDSPHSRPNCASATVSLRQHQLQRSKSSVHRVAPGPQPEPALWRGGPPLTPGSQTISSDPAADHQKQFATTRSSAPVHHVQPNPLRQHKLCPLIQTCQVVLRRRSQKGHLSSTPPPHPTVHPPAVDLAPLMSTRPLSQFLLVSGWSLPAPARLLPCPPAPPGTRAQAPPKAPKPRGPQGCGVHKATKSTEAAARSSRRSGLQCFSSLPAQRVRREQLAASALPFGVCARAAARS
ncbi:hypothetical protein NDU88_004429 [Pleurodeles waltl]|uniref:Uncharacterized protein n=1 Tax=Pleurodeles waltl TaxID=8319 RepID=A0AAV7W842_PLEWA|nr:hypothetical protein NDU88_004429 [Pleurodeles waltl]